MTPYLLVLLAVSVAAYLGRRGKTRFSNGFGIVFAGTILIVFAAVRDIEVGTDTIVYVYRFWQSYTFERAFVGGMEPGFEMLTWLARLLSSTYAIFLGMVAAVVVTLYLYAIRTMVARYEAAIYLFVTLGLYTFLFNGARQAIAGAVCFFGLRFVLQRRLLAYLACVALAMLFHKSALVALPIYAVALPRLRLWSFAAIGVAVLALWLFLGQFVDLAAQLVDDRFAKYAVEADKGGLVMVAFLLGQGVLFLWLKRYVKVDRVTYTRFLNIYLISLVPALTSVVSQVHPSGLLRLHYYFSGVAILMWPLVFKEMPGRQRVLIGWVFIVTTLAFFVLTTSAFSNLVPYRMNLEIL